MRKLFSVTLASGLLMAGSAVADDAGPNFTLGASASYVYDFNDADILNEPIYSGIEGPGSELFGAQIANQLLYSNGEQDESFNLDLVQLGVSGQRGIVMYGAKVDFGDLAGGAGDDSDGDVGLQEAYLSIDTGLSGLTVTAGRFGTPIGYEVLEPWANANISRSLAWALQPINHDGVTLAMPLGPVDAMIGVANGFTVDDPIANNPDDEYAVLGSLGTTVGPLDLYFAGIYSEESETNDVWELNTIVSGTCGSCSYALEFTYYDSEDADLDVNDFQVEDAFDAQVWDLTGYFGVDYGPWSVDFRASYLQADDLASGLSAVIGSSSSALDSVDIWTVTITGGYEIVEGVQVRAEYRHDDADEEIYFDDDTPNGLDGNVDVISAQIVWTP